MLSDKVISVDTSVVIMVQAVVIAVVLSFISPTLLFAEASQVSVDKSGGADVKKKPEKAVTVTSDTMESNRSKGVIIFRGKVVAEQDHLMCSEELRVFYGDEQQVKDMVATGNVRIVQTGMRARGDKVVYNKAQGKLVITGNAAAKQCGDIVRGAKITFYLDNDNVMVEGGDQRVRAVIMPQKENKECLEGPISEEFRCQRAR